MADINVQIIDSYSLNIMISDEIINVQSIEGQPINFKIGEEQPVNFDLMLATPEGGIFSNPPSGKLEVTNVYYNSDTKKLVVVYK